MSTNTTGAFSISSAQSDIMSMINSGTAFDTSSLTKLSGAQSSISEITSQFNILSSLNVSNLSVSNSSKLGVDSGLDLSGITAMSGSFESALTSPLSNLYSHMSDHYTNFTKNMSIYVSNLGVQQGLNKLGVNKYGAATDICSDITNFFGSIMGTGLALINTVISSISVVISSISSLIEQIQNAISTVTQTIINTIQNAISTALSVVQNTVSQITNMITTEVAALAAAVSNMVTFGSMHVLSSLFNNPCAKLAITAVGSAALVTALSSI